MNSQFKENRQVTHNSIFADFALPHSEFRSEIHRAVIPQLRDGGGRISTIQNQTVKDPRSCIGTKQSPTLVNNLTKTGSTLSPEELQPHAWSRTAYRGTSKIYEYRIWSIKIYTFLANLTTVIRVNPYSFVVSIFVCLRSHRFVIKDQAAAGHAGFGLLQFR